MTSKEAQGNIAQVSSVFAVPNKWHCSHFCPISANSNQQIFHSSSNYELYTLLTFWKGCHIKVLEIITNVILSNTDNDKSIYFYIVFIDFFLDRDE